MAWNAIANYPNWEYSDNPNTDKRSQDTYDYDEFTNHIAGIVTRLGNEIYIYCRKKVGAIGYGEISKEYTDGLALPVLPENVISSGINSVTDSIWFSPDGVIAGSIMTVGQDDLYSLNGTDFINTPFEFVVGMAIMLRTTSSGVYEGSVNATLLDDGVNCATMIVTNPAEQSESVIAGRYTEVENYLDGDNYL